MKSCWFYHITNSHFITKCDSKKNLVKNSMESQAQPYSSDPDLCSLQFFQSSLGARLKSIKSEGGLQNRIRSQQYKRRILKVRPVSGLGVVSFVISYVTSSFCFRLMHSVFCVNVARKAKTMSRPNF